MTVGRTVSALAPVVNCAVCNGTALPAESCAPSIVTVKVVEAGSGTCGTSVTIVLPVLKVTLAGIGPKAVESDSVPAAVVIGLTASLKWSRTVALMPTPVAPSGGAIPVSAGGVASLIPPV